MITLRTTAHIDEKGQLSVKLPESFLPGEYELVIVIDEKPVEKETGKRLKFASYPYLVPAGETFRREDMYEDEGR
jgi:hypothetical protein